MHINLSGIALQVLAAVDAAGHLHPGDQVPMPTVHFNEKDVHIDVQITVRRDAAPAQSKTVGPSSTAKG